MITEEAEDGDIGCSICGGNGWLWSEEIDGLVDCIYCNGKGYTGETTLENKN